MRKRVANKLRLGNVGASILCLFISPILLGADQNFRSSSQKVHLLELYSTQSCSSCPPAQRWVSNLKSDPNLWKTFIPVVFHVDYWDYLGWKDPYSDSKYTNRQRSYVFELGSAGYTPMFILDGRETRVRNKSPLKNMGDQVGNLRAIRRDNKFKVMFSPKDANMGDLIAHYAILGNGIKTNVTSGENDGKILAHDFLSLEMGQVMLEKAHKSYRGNFSVELSKIKNAPEKAIVIWISSQNSLKPLQAVGGVLKE